MSDRAAGIPACQASSKPSMLLADRVTVYAVEEQQDDGSWKIVNTWEDEGDANGSRFHILDKQQKLTRLKQLTVIQRSTARK